mmetsp:Transcript_19407/g.45401  ORF Transcript_19407/g.45401 Transcript_19407/m.45401 type:complete len:250 (+) Transcript_19407:442-1191(+)|eukprot:CAMPEP_0114544684 /NCGR_PEP_ID=MMETSP0114-20121206/3005_1 /TAXON_ID=31324 /ORGANISM="Goniomonas sp, Strain m" /LENGTH=249 /DNA_ID=CAMNT_0001729075 /DNA_START=387 /DNA_END=1136 /DNA_ORIENTATION=+
MELFFREGCWLLRAETSEDWDRWLAAFRSVKVRVLPFFLEEQVESVDALISKQLSGLISDDTQLNLQHPNVFRPLTRALAEGYGESTRAELGQVWAAFDKDKVGRLGWEESRGLLHCFLDRFARHVVEVAEEVVKVKMKKMLKEAKETEAPQDLLRRMARFADAYRASVLKTVAGFLESDMLPQADELTDEMLDSLDANADQCIDRAGFVANWSAAFCGTVYVRIEAVLEQACETARVYAETQQWLPAV